MATRRHTRVRWQTWAAGLAGLLLCLCCRRAGAEIPPSWLGQRIEAIEILGEARGRISPREVGVPVGVPLTRALVRQAITRLAGTGLYRDVQLDARRSERGITLMVRLSPRIVAMRIDIDGNAHLEPREVLRNLEIKEEGEVDRDKLPEAQARIEARYAELGYRHAQVRVLLRDTDDATRKVVRVEVAEGAPTRIVDYEFVGDPMPKRKGLRRTLTLNRGEPLDLEQVRLTLEGVQRKLREAGYYEARLGTPEPVIDGERALVRVPSRVGPHYEVVILGPWPLSRGEVLEALQLPEQPLDPSNFRALEGRVREQYKLRGYVDAQVYLHTRPPPEHKPEANAQLRVRIEAGEPLEIASVRFVGAQHYTQDFLREQLYSYLGEDLPSSVISQPVDSEVADSLGFSGERDGRQRELRPPPLSDPRRLYYGPTYEEAIDHIRDLYRGEGYLSVKISQAELRPVPHEAHTAEALITVEEGPRTYVYEVRVDGNVQVTTYDLLAAANLQTGAPFSYLALEQARVRALDAYRERGFFYATVEPAVRLSDDGTRAEIVFEIVERFVVRVGAVRVHGAERSNERMILNRLTLHAGDIYRPSQARVSEEQLLSLDVFSSVSIAPEEADLPARVKTIVISVTERRSQWLGWNGGFSTGEGVRGGVEYGYRNLFGGAVHATLRGQLGYQIVFLDEEIKRNYEGLDPDQRIEYQANAGLSTPYIPNAPKIGAGLDFVVLQDLQRDFRMQKESVIASLYYRPHKKVVLTFAEELEESFFQLFNKDRADLGNVPVSELVPDGQNTLVSTHVSASWDLRDRAFNPQKGALFNVTSQWARTLRDDQQTVNEGSADERTVVFKSNMLRFAATVAFYVPLGEKLVFASQLRWGRVVHLTAGSQAYPNRLFYLGGINFRGFRQNEMVPQDVEEDPNLNPNAIVSHGGQTFVAAQNELRFPLFGQLYGGLFSDIGNLWADPTRLDLRELEVTVGLGVRLQTPVAALAFDYGVRQVDLGPFELRGAFQFAFQRF